MTQAEIHELLYQALETEIGGVQVYRTALQCALNEDLQREWAEYLEQTEEHERILRELFEAIGLDPEKQTPGRRVVRHIAEGLVSAMQLAHSDGPAAAAELVAAECVVHAETKDHLNWELLGVVATELKSSSDLALRDVLRKACERVEEEEDEHLYHSAGWARELWVQALGLPAVLPPPEEERGVKTAIGAARAKQERSQWL
jgi:hypothetical protein